MSNEVNKTIVKRFMDEIMNAGIFAAIPGLFVPRSMLAGGIENQMKAMRMPFPDIHFTIDELIAEGNKVAF